MIRLMVTTTVVLSEEIARSIEMTYRKFKRNTVNDIPLSNRHSNGENQLRGQGILVTLCQLPTRQLDRTIISSRIIV